MLLEEIVTLLSTTSGSLTDALLKTKVLLHKIGRKDLVPWVNSELTGYPDDNVPAYRIVSMSVHGQLTSIAWQMKDYLLPLLHLKPDEKKQLTRYALTASIQIVEQSVKHYREKGGGMMRNLPVESAALFRDVLEPGVNVIRAWCEVNMAEVENILAEVRSRLLDFTLELQDAVGAATEGDQLEKRAANVDAGRLFNMAIHGSGNTVLLGNHSSQSITLTNEKGDIDALLAALSGIGVPKSELEELKHAVKQDESGGSAPVVSAGKTGEWFIKTLGRAGKGAINVSVDLLSSVVVKALAAYSGITA